MNRTTFESEGTVFTDSDDLSRHVPVPSSTVGAVPHPSSSNGYVTNAWVTLSPATPVTAASTETDQVKQYSAAECEEINAQLEVEIASKEGSSTAGAKKDDSRISSSIIRVTNDSFSLIVTIAVGCALLFVNVIVLASICFQRDKMRKERKRRQEEEEEAERDDDEGDEGERELQLAESESTFTLKGVVENSREVGGTGNCSSTALLGRSPAHLPLAVNHTPHYATLNHVHSPTLAKQPIVAFSSSTATSNYYTAPRRPANGRTMLRQQTVGDGIPTNHHGSDDVLHVTANHHSPSNNDNRAKILVSNHLQKNHHQNNNPSTLV